MNWIRENWFWIVVAVLFLWMHGSMHGGHGQQGGARKDERDTGDPHAQH